MTASPQEAEAEAVPAPAASGQPVRRGAQRASIVTTRPGLPPVTALPAATDSDRPARAGRAAGHLAGALRAARAGAVVTAQPPSLAAARARVHESAGQWHAPLARYPRLAWGYAWLALTAALYALLWVNEYPSIAAVVALVITVVVLFH